MNIHDYCTKGGKNLIKEYLDELPEEERLEGYLIRHKIMVDGISAFYGLNVRQLRGKLWEIKFSHEIATALKRAREAGL